MGPFRVHMEAEGRPNGGLGVKPPEKGPLGPIGRYWALLDLLWVLFALCGPYGVLGEPIGRPIYGEATLGACEQA